MWLSSGGPYSRNIHVPLQLPGSGKGARASLLCMGAPAAQDTEPRLSLLPGHALSRTHGHCSADCFSPPLEVGTPGHDGTNLSFCWPPRPRWFSHPLHPPPPHPHLVSGPGTYVVRPGLSLSLSSSGIYGMKGVWDGRAAHLDALIQIWGWVGVLWRAFWGHLHLSQADHTLHMLHPDPH